MRDEEDDAKRACWAQDANVVQSMGPGVRMRVHSTQTSRKGPEQRDGCQDSSGNVSQGTPAGEIVEFARKMRVEDPAEAGAQVEILPFKL